MAKSVSRSDLVASIIAKDPTFKFSKKKHTVAVLTKYLATLKGAPKTRIKDGVRDAVGEEVKIPGRDTQRFVILKAMKEGTTIEGLMKVTGWTRQSVTGALRTDVRDACGLSYEVKGAMIKLILPKGVSLEA